MMWLKMARKNKISNVRISLLLALSLIVLIVYNIACTRDEAAGKALSKQYCVACHSYPDPGLLPKSVWKEHVLPAMAGFADLYADETGHYKKMTAEMMDSKPPFAENLSFSISPEDLQQIVDYYLLKAPEKLRSDHQPIATTLTQFEVIKPQKRRKANTSCVFIDSARSMLFVADLKKPGLQLYNAKLELVDTFPDAKLVVDVSPQKTVNQKSPRYLFTHLGSFNPSPFKYKGSVELVEFEGKTVRRKTLLDSLNRSVQAITTDVDHDGLKDIIVCEFGFLQGKLSLFKNTGKGYIKRVMSNLAGAEKIYEDDINHDGKPDFWVLFASGYEGIVQFINKGNGTFEQKEVLSFPPSYGSTSFSLVDFNKDGKKDILYTCGDNADLSQVLKPYHGIYIYENTGQHFKQRFFQPMHGCYKAVAADFNQDGKLDIAAISFFADYEKAPQEGFELLQGTGNYRFKVSTIPAVNSGRWICMDVNDLDGDGDMDIVLGNLGARPGNDRILMNKWLDGPEFLFLKNKLK